MSYDNLVQIAAQATQHDHHLAATAWHRYNDILGTMAESAGLPLASVVGVFSALSPNNDCTGNLRDTRKLLQAAQRGLDYAEFTVSTYGANKSKAWQIVHGVPPLELIRAKKTRNFYLNVYDPSDPAPVTVDGHIINAWRGVRAQLNSAEMKNYSANYDEIADDLRKLAAQLQVLPNVAQGLVWFSWKRIHKILYATQLEFWPTDYLAAGLGFH